MVQPYLDRGYRGFAADALLSGSVETVAEELRALAALGFTDVICRNLTDNQAQALETIERLGAVKALL